MAYGIFRKVTTLEFFQHHFAKSGHGDGLLMPRQLISTFRQPPLHYLTRSVRRTSGFVLADDSGVIARWLESTCRVRPRLGVAGLRDGLLVLFDRDSLKRRGFACHPHRHQDAGWYRPES